MWWLCLLFASLASAQTCRVLALEGGASFGPYEAGAFQAAVNLLPAVEVQYNAVVGISAGSLNALVLAQFPMGQEQQAASLMHEVFYDLNGSKDIYVDWKGGIVEGLTFRSGIYNDEPLRGTIKKYFKSINRNITVGTTSLDDGSFINFNETVGANNMIEASICSSSIPGVFPVQHFMGYNFVDGAKVYNNDIGSAIKRCYDVTGDYTKITIDMFSCYNHDLNATAADLKSFDVRDRVNQIKGYDNGLINLYAAITAFPTVNFRYYIQPSVSLGKTSFNFTHDALEYNYQMGLKDGNTVITKNIYARQIIDEWIAGNGGAIRGKKITIE